MALIVVNLTDTFDDWRTKTNTSIAQIGDLATLTASNSASIVGALNGMLEDVIDDTTPQLGGDLDLNSKDITGTGNVNITGILTATSIAGTVVGTTQSVNNNSTKLATTAYVDAQVATEDTLAEMNDTTVSSPANLDLLQYNSGTSKWVNTAIGAVVGVTQAVGNNSTKLATTAYVDAQVATEDTLAEMNDTVMSGLANLDVLQYNGTNWVNKTMTAAGIPTSGFTVAMAIALG